MAEPVKRTSNKWCSCGYKNRKGEKGEHEQGAHHSKPKK